MTTHQDTSTERDEAAQQPQGQAVSDLLVFAEEVRTLSRRLVGCNEVADMLRHSADVYTSRALALRDKPEQRVPLSADYLTIRVKHEEGSYFVTVDQDPGIAVASPDLALCLSDVLPSIEALRKLNGITAHGAGGEPT